MSEQKNWLLPVALIAAALILVVGFNWSNIAPQKSGNEAVVQLPSYLTKTPFSQSTGSALSSSDGVISFADDSGNAKRLISVSGTITKSIAPEQASVVFSVETLDKSASKSQSDNAELADKVQNALKAAGIEEKDIKTVSYNLQEEFQWNELTRKSETVGYRTTNSIQVTVKDLAKTGSIIDVAVQAGANRVSSVSFSLSKATEEQLKVSALQEAAANAKTKAQSIATGLGISVGQVYSASESSNYTVPYYARNYAMEAVAGEAKSAPTPITPGDIEYNATVSVQFEIQ